MSTLLDRVISQNQNLETSNTYADQLANEYTDGGSGVVEQALQTVETPEPSLLEQIHAKRNQPASYEEQLVQEQTQPTFEGYDEYKPKTSKRYFNDPTDHGPNTGAMGDMYNSAGNFINDTFGTEIDTTKVQDGKKYMTGQKIFNDMPVGDLRAKIMNAPEDPNGDQTLYYMRVLNDDGTASYKAGLAHSGAMERYKEDAAQSGGRLTILMDKRVSNAGELEGLIHGNKDILGQRRYDLKQGEDDRVLEYGYTEVYNDDFLSLDGTVSEKKLKSLNMTNEAKWRKLGLDKPEDAWDEKNVKSARDHIDKRRKLFGSDDMEAATMEGELKRQFEWDKSGMKEGRLMNSVDAFQSGAHQLGVGIADMALDILTPGDNELLNEYKSSEWANDFYGYDARVSEYVMEDNLREWRKGNYVGAAFGALTSPEVIAESLPEMGAMFIGLGEIAVANRIKNVIKLGEMAAKKGATLEAKGLTVTNTIKKKIKKGLEAKKEYDELNLAVKASGVLASEAGFFTVVANKTNNDIDERIKNDNGKPVGMATIAGMFLLETAAYATDKAVFKNIVSSPSAKTSLKDMIKGIPDKSAKKLVSQVGYEAGQIVKAGGGEFFQEYTQQWAEIFSQKFGTENHGYDMFTDENYDGALKAAIAGLGAGGMMHAAGTVVSKTMIEGTKEYKKRTSKGNQTEGVDPAPAVDPDEQESEIMSGLHDFTSKEEANDPLREDNQENAVTSAGHYASETFEVVDESDLEQVNNSWKFIDTLANQYVDFYEKEADPAIKKQIMQAITELDSISESLYNKQMKYYADEKATAAPISTGTEEVGSASIESMISKAESVMSGSSETKTEQEVGKDIDDVIKGFMKFFDKKIDNSQALNDTEIEALEKAFGKNGFFHENLSKIKDRRVIDSISSMYKILEAVKGTGEILGNFEQKMQDEVERAYNENRDPNKKAVKDIKEVTREILFGTRADKKGKNKKIGLNDYAKQIIQAVNRGNTPKLLTLVENLKHFSNTQQEKLDGKNANGFDHTHEFIAQVSTEKDAIDAMIRVVEQAMENNKEKFEQSLERGKIQQIAAKVSYEVDNSADNPSGRRSGKNVKTTESSVVPKGDEDLGAKTVLFSIKDDTSAAIEPFLSKDTTVPVENRHLTLVGFGLAKDIHNYLKSITDPDKRAEEQKKINDIIEKAKEKITFKPKNEFYELSRTTKNPDWDDTTTIVQKYEANGFDSFLKEVNEAMGKTYALGMGPKAFPHVTISIDSKDSNSKGIGVNSLQDFKSMVTPNGLESNMYTDKATKVDLKGKKKDKAAQDIVKRVEEGRRTIVLEPKNLENAVFSHIVNQIKDKSVYDEYVKERDALTNRKDNTKDAAEKYTEQALVFALERFDNIKDLSITTSEGIMTIKNRAKDSKEKNIDSLNNLEEENIGTGFVDVATDFKDLNLLPKNQLFNYMLNIFNADEIIMMKNSNFFEDTEVQVVLDNLTDNDIANIRTANEKFINDFGATIDKMVSNKTPSGKQIPGIYSKAPGYLLLEDIIDNPVYPQYIKNIMANALMNKMLVASSEMAGSIPREKVAKILKKKVNKVTDEEIKEINKLGKNKTELVNDIADDIEQMLGMKTSEVEITSTINGEKITLSEQNEEYKRNVALSLATAAVNAILHPDMGIAQQTNITKTQFDSINSNFAPKKGAKKDKATLNFVSFKRTSKNMGAYTKSFISKKATNFRDVVGETTDSLNAVMNPNREKSGYQFDKPFKPVSTKDYYKGTNEHLSQDSADSINVQKNEAYTLSSSANILIAQGEAFLLDYFGYNKDIEENTHIDKLDSERSKNERIRKNVTDLLALVEELKARKANGQSSEFYYNFTAWKNGREGMTTTKLTPQNDTDIRFMINTLNTGQEVSMSDSKTEYAFKMMVLQGLGSNLKGNEFAGEDKHGYSTLSNFFDALIVDKDMQEALAVLRTRRQDGKENTPFSDKEAEIIKAVAPNSHALSALNDLSRYDPSNLKQPFLVETAIETDAVTSGFALNLLQYPILGKDLHKWLHKVGIYSKDSTMADGKPVTSGAAFLEQEGERDSYQEIMLGVFNDMEILKQDHQDKIDANKAGSKNVSDKEAADSQKWIDEMNSIETITGKFVEETVDANGKVVIGSDGNPVMVVTKAGREFAKYPLMTYMYGQGLDGMRESKTESISEKLFGILEEIAEENNDGKAGTLSTEDRLAMWRSPGWTTTLRTREASKTSPDEDISAENEAFFNIWLQTNDAQMEAAEFNIVLPDNNDTNTEMTDGMIKLKTILESFFGEGEVSKHRENANGTTMFHNLVTKYDLRNNSLQLTPFGSRIDKDNIVPVNKILSELVDEVEAAADSGISRILAENLKESFQEFEDVRSDMMEAAELQFSFYERMVAEDIAKFGEAYKKKTGSKKPYVPSRAAIRMIREKNLEYAPSVSSGGTNVSVVKTQRATSNDEGMSGAGIEYSHTDLSRVVWGVAGKSSTTSSTIQGITYGEAANKTGYPVIGIHLRDAQGIAAVHKRFHSSSIFDASKFKINEMVNGTGYYSKGIYDISFRDSLYGSTLDSLITLRDKLGEKNSNNRWVAKDEYKYMKFTNGKGESITPKQLLGEVDSKIKDMEPMNNKIQAERTKLQGPDGITYMEQAIGAGMKINHEGNPDNKYEITYKEGEHSSFINDKFTNPRADTKKEVESRTTHSDNPFNAQRLNEEMKEIAEAYSEIEIEKGVKEKDRLDFMNLFRDIRRRHNEGILSGSELKSFRAKLKEATNKIEKRVEKKRKDFGHAYTAGEQVKSIHEFIENTKSVQAGLTRGDTAKEKRQRKQDDSVSALYSDIEKDLKQKLLSGSLTLKPGVTTDTENINVKPENILDMFDKIAMQDKDLSDPHIHTLKGILNEFVIPLLDQTKEIEVVLGKVSGAMNYGESISTIDKDGSEKHQVKVYISSKESGSRVLQSAAEVYVHELVHAISVRAMAKDSKIPGYVRARIMQLHRIAEKNTTWEDFLPKDAQGNIVYINDRTAEEIAAKDMWAYVFNNSDKKSTGTSVGVTEFIAYGLSNPHFKKKLEDIDVDSVLGKFKSWQGLKDMSLYDILASLFQKMYEIVFEKGSPFSKLKGKKISVNSELGKMILELNGINADKQNWLAKKFEGVANKLLSADEWVRLKTYYIQDGLMTGNEYDNAPFMAKNITRIINLVKNMEDMPMISKKLSQISKIDGMGERGIVRELFSQIFGNDSAIKDYIPLALRASAEIDSERKGIATAVTDKVHSFFTDLDHKLTKHEDESLSYVVIEADMTALVDAGLSIDEIIELLQNTDKREKLIEEYRSRLEHYDPTGEMFLQAKGLGEYMMLRTSKFGTQEKNAAAIAEYMSKNTSERSMTEVEYMIDALASLFAIEHIPTKRIDDFVSLSKDAREGVENVINLHQAYKNRSLKEEFDGNKTFMNKGYLAEVTDEDTSVEVAAIDAETQKRMLQNGYTLTETINMDGINVGGSALGIYYSNTSNSLTFDAGALSLIDKHRSGTSLFELFMQDKEWNKGNMKLAEKFIEREVRRRNDSGFNPKHDSLSFFPQYNKKGKIVDFRYEMPKATRAKILNRESRSSVLLGRMNGRIEEKKAANSINEEVAEKITMDYKRELKKDNDELTGEQDLNKFTYVGPDSTTDEMIDYWNQLPDSFKTRVTEMNKNIDMPGPGFYIRTKAINIMLGRRRFSLSNMKVAGAEVFQDHNLKRIIRMVEKHWANVVSLNKVGIVIKTPIVLVQNIISNFIQILQSGGDIAAVYRYNVEGFKYAEEHMHLMKELRSLKVDMMMDMNDVKRKILQARIVRLLEALDANPLNYMYKEGFNQSIVDEIDTQKYQYQGEDVNKIASTIDDYIPENLRNVAQMVFMTERTAAFKFMTRVTQYSDFVSRYAYDQINKKNFEKNLKTELAIYRKKMNNAKTEISEEALAILVKEEEARKRKQYEEERIWKLSNAHIHYGLLDHSLIDYANRMGFLMFTKFLFGIQRQIWLLAKEHPATVVALILLQYLIPGGDADDVMDSSLLVKGIESRVHLNPFDHISGAITPYGIKMITDAMGVTE